MKRITRSSTPESRTYTVGRHEKGWYVERGDGEVTILIRGPFGTKMEADAAAKEIEAIVTHIRRCKCGAYTMSPHPHCPVHPS